ncbi:MAG: hypothetical protein J2P18_08185, partial [Nocardia sp.]|nr:hypothetical protein [Nocardia sp.]
MVLVGGAIALAAGWHSHTTTASGATPSLISAIPAEHPAAPAHSPAPPVGAPPAIIPGYQVVTIADHG